MWKRIIQAIRDFLWPEYVITVWFPKQIADNQVGRTISFSEPKQFHVRSIIWISHTAILAKDLHGKKLVVRSKEKFNYNVERVR